MKGVPASLKSSMIILLCREDLRVGTIVTQLENLNVMGVIGSWGGRGQRQVGTIIATTKYSKLSESGRLMALES